MPLLQAHYENHRQAEKAPVSIPWRRLVGLLMASWEEQFAEHLAMPPETTFDERIQ